LAQRLGEKNGPEVVLVSTGHAPSYFDQITMDRTRSLFIRRLQSADVHGRFRIYSPVTSLGRTIIVHAKLAIIDDVMLRVGSSNINNRSLGLDSECDLTIEAAGPGADRAKTAIRRIRTHLIAHWLGCDDAVFTAALTRAGSLGAAIEAMRTKGLCRLRPIPPVPLKPLTALIATFHLGDPVGPGDSWRPWRRRASVRRELKLLAERLRGASLPAPAPRLSPQTT
ncbi:phospholipase D-like domain-containing protein, partial [Phenylobacterium sp.]|uniref:phospholipase D-like domain-containing protein n=1 Tax=Phenylobacterium sp. TaxID=1871053 RepID=UPI00286CF435